MFTSACVSCARWNFAHFLSHMALAHMPWMSALNLLWHKRDNKRGGRASGGLTSLLDHFACECSGQ
eukprot:622296-Pleurochrysis_carterae.AAC.3